MDSVLAEFYGPLWEEYHIFGLNTGDGSDMEKKEEIIEKLSNYMSYTFEPNRDLDKSIYKEGIELYDIALDSASVNNQTMLMDYKGQLLINEAVEYMKYQEIGDGLELLLDKMSLLETPKKVSAIYEEKQKVEEELVVIDEEILVLMELLDGIKTGKKGIELSKDGKLETTEYYIKKICYEAVTKDAVGINQESVFLALKDGYVNPALEFGLIKESFSKLVQVLKQLEDLQVQQGIIALERSKQQIQLSALNSIDKKSNEVKRQMKETEKNIKMLEEDNEELLKEAKEKAEIKDQLSDSINLSQNKLSRLIHLIKPLIKEAISSIDQITKKAEIAAPLIKQYEDMLYKEKDSIGDEIFVGLEENLKELKRYTTEDGSNYNFAGMKEILERNITILNRTEMYLFQGEDMLIAKKYQNSEAYFSEAADTLSSYQIEGLALDYSTLVLDKSEAVDPLGEVGPLLQSGITSLVIDPSKISKSEITKGMLPSVISAMAKEDTDFLSVLSSFFENTVIGGMNSGTGNLFGSFSSTAEFTAMAGDSINMVAEHFLYQEYLKEHFGMFPREGEDIKARKPAVLIYEQEYLLAGKMSDQDNLSSVVSRIIFLRTILDFVSILGDKTKINEAKLAASALVGFTGLPILVSITQTIILLVWSFAEALVDTCALMMGKEVPILKKKVVLELPELFLLGRTFLQTKASKIVDTKELSFSYHDYLRVFLMTKNKEDLAYRSMDLIQENINIRYIDTFKIQNCLFGYMVKADFKIKPKFTAFSFVQKQIGSNNGDFLFSTEAAYSY
ncbi:MAG: DUF5702 domain-containing protein [Mobilitalea sp.]